MTDNVPAARKAPRGISWPLNTLLVLPKYRLMYLPIAKNACSSLKKLVLGLSGLVAPQALGDIGDIHKFVAQSKIGLKLSDYPADTAAGMLADPAYSRFCVLRDPRRRLVSAYLQKFVVYRTRSESARQPAAPITRPVIEWVYAQRNEQPDWFRSISFEEFVSYLAAHGDAALDGHWKPQACYLANLDFDFIGRVERMADVQQFLRGRLGFEQEFPRLNVVKADKESAVDATVTQLLPQQLAQFGDYPAWQAFMAAGMEPAICDRYKDDVALYEQRFGPLQDSGMDS